ncbi:MAG TPA: thermonuclease family protein [Methylovorus sp.]|nr:thermonuclease family protein [Methylovorus sp.]
MALTAHADVSGKVVYIADGDTLTIKTVDKLTYKVRLQGIDAPEKAQAFGNKSKQALAECARGKEAMIENQESDQYGRLLGKVWVDGNDCNLRQLKLGMAWHYKHYAREQTQADRLIYAAAEQTARDEKRGLWADANPTAPWDFRQQENLQKPQDALKQQWMMHNHRFR